MGSVLGRFIAMTDAMIDAGVKDLSLVGPMATSLRSPESMPKSHHCPRVIPAKEAAKHRTNRPPVIPAKAGIQNTNKKAIGDPLIQRCANV